MIHVNGEYVEVEGTVPNIVEDIVSLFKSVKLAEPNEYETFRKTAIFAIFSLCCTPEELEKILNSYKDFDKFRKELFHEK